MSNNGSKWIRPARRRAIYARDRNACVWCGQPHAVIVDARGPVARVFPLTLDHVRPVAAGGTHASRNLVTCCYSCNSAKQSLSPRQWYAALRRRGIDTRMVRARVRRHTARKLNLGRAD